MKLLSLALLGLLLAPSTSAQTAARDPSSEKPAKEKCSVAGTVVRLSDGAPLKTAIVGLVNPDDPQERTDSAVTDSEGRFQLKGVNPGRYRLMVDRRGFVSQEYGQKKPSDPGAALTLAPGQEIRDLVFRMIPSAVIAGHVANEDGEPLPSAEVAALREFYLEGTRMLLPAALVQTNDLGEYRLFGLSPGRYFVKVSYKLGERTRFRGNSHLKGDDKSAQGYVPEYYPGVPELSKATTVAVKAGEEVPSVDIPLRPVNVFSIRGKVHNTLGKTSEIGVFLELVPKNSGLLWGHFDTETTFPKNKEGSFEFGEVLPGSYLLTLEWSDEGKTYRARQDIEVGNADVEGVSLTIAPGMTINGHVTWEGKPSIERDEFGVYLSGADGYDALYGGASAKVTPDGTFSLTNVSEGDYRLATYGESQDCFLKAVRHGSSNALEEGFKAQRGSDASLEVTMSSRGARVKGSVVDADGLPAAGVWVVLVPDEAHRNQGRRLFKQNTTDQYGHFELRGIAPGDYKLFSWNEVEQGAWADPDFLKPFEDKGEKVSLQEGDAKSVELVAIKTAMAEQQKP
jgi:protocatechuate 3,4-dioxygenase beta subunit